MEIANNKLNIQLSSNGLEGGCLYPAGAKGDTGVGITKIEKTATSGLIDTYTITFSDNSTTTFNVTNGAKGDTGKTAYANALEGGYTGTEADFNTDLGSISGFAHELSIINGGA